MSAFLTGLLCGGLASSIVLWILSGLVRWIDSGLRLPLLAVLVLGGLLRDLNLIRTNLPQSRRQVPRSIFRKGIVLGSLQFGLELGVGWTTYLTSTLPYVLGLAILLIPSIEMAVVAGIGFGLGRGLPSLLRLASAHGEAWDGLLAHRAQWVAPLCASAALFTAAGVTWV